jgi:methyl-accepting chemotaxis protein
MRVSFSGLGFKKKIWGLCILFMMPIIGLMWLLASAYNKDIDFAKQEERGVKLLQRAVPAFEKAWEVKWLRDVGTPSSEKEGELQRMVKQLEETIAELSFSLKFDEDNLNVRGRGNASADALQKTMSAYISSNTSESWSEFNSSLKTIIGHAGDTSNLILDPDLDSYYLMDVVVVAYVAAFDRLFATLTSKLKAGSIQDHQIGMSIVRDVDMDRITVDLKTALAEDANFYELNDRFQNTVSKDSAEFSKVILALTNRLIGESKIKAESVTEELMIISKLGKQFWENSSIAMYEMFDARIADYRSKQMNALLFNLLFLSILVVLAILIVRAISNSLNQVTEDVAVQVEAVTQLSKKLTSASTNLSSSTTQQSAAIDQVVSSVEEITAMLGKTSENASESRNSVTQGKRISDHGKASIGELTQAMDQMRSITVSLGQMAQSIGEVAAKTKVINDIVFETRILSFNASIEAARAGQFGRGFSVVADEVSKLAVMSGKAAEEIRTILDTSTKIVDDVVSGTGRRVDAGLEAADKCKQSFDSSDSSIQSILDSVTSIERAVQEQSIGLKQTNQAMNEMDGLTQKNAKAAEDLASEAKLLTDGAQKLSQVVQNLRFIVHGSRVS